MNKKGLTLVEVIVSVAILGILAVTFIPILSNQYVGIVGTGKKSKATYFAVEEVEKAIKGKGDYKNSGELELKIKFPNEEDEIKIKVEERIVEKKDKTGEKSTDIKIGIPKIQ